MKPSELIQRFEDEAPTRLETVIKAVDAEKRIVYGEVYTPNVLDTHGEMMLAADVELMAHRFLATMKNDQIDLMHNNRVVAAVVVESYIAKADDPMYNEGAWVMAIKIDDEELWDAIKRGEYNGFSVEAMVTKVEAEIELAFLPHIFGEVHKADGHSHFFFLQIDDEGNIVRGATSEEGGHVHTIRGGTATELQNDHAHRFALP